MVSKTSSEVTMPDDQLPPDEQRLEQRIVAEVIARSLEDAVPEQRANTEGERSVTQTERTVTREYSKLQGNKRGRGRRKK